MTALAPSPEHINAMAERLRAAGLVAFPTETVYGLGALASDARAVANVFAIKGRPQFNPLIAHVASTEAAFRLGAEDAPLAGLGPRLADAFWPGPLTLVLRRTLESDAVADLAAAGLDTVAVRVPSHPVALALLDAVDAPVVGPSANRSGRVSPTTAEHVVSEFGDAVPVLDGGPCDVGLESTIVGLIGDVPVLLRPGAITREALAEVLGRPVSVGTPTAHPPQPGDGPLAPGQLASHYAPNAAVILDVAPSATHPAYLAFGATEPPTGLVKDCINLSPSGDLSEAASRLYCALRELDATEPDVIAVAPIPHDGLGAAINDRLQRAAAPRTT